MPTDYQGPVRRINRGRGHSYQDVNGRKVPGVTTVIGNGIPKPALINWAANTTIAYAVDHWDELSAMSVSARIKVLEKARFADRDAAANRGTKVHKLGEKLIAGLEVDVPEELAGHVESYVRFLDEFQVEPVLIEFVVMSHRYGYAGTGDAIADLASGPDGAIERWLLDLKGLAVETPIPTPGGWATMGSLRVGDEVFASDGSVCRVTHKSGLHLRPCHRLRFDDGSTLVCDEEHRWLVHSGRAPGSALTVRTTAEIADTLTVHEQHHHRVPLAAPLNLPAADLPVDPYVLGAWLGDGSSASGVITKPDDELFELIAERGFRVGPSIASKDRCPTRTIYGLRGQLRAAGLLGDKHVPDAYLRASQEQRLDLLRGLMDTDGTVHRSRKQAQFCSTDKALGYAVRELVVSLGERCVIHEVTGTGFGRSVTSWRVAWHPQRHNPFLLGRKAGLVNMWPVAKSRQRIITAAPQTLTVTTQCIAVDSADHTYLCGEQMIPTHNTSRSGVFGETALQLAGYRYADVYLGADGQEHPMLTVQRTGVVHVRADGYELVPVTADPRQHRDFLYVQQVARFVDESRDLVLDAIEPPRAREAA